MAGASAFSGQAERVVVGRFVLGHPIASGGMATVYLARDVEADTSDVFAIKRLHAHLARDPEFVAMFLDEARMTSHIAHANVVRTHEVVEANGEVFLVMEYVEGESLARLLKTYAPPTFDVIARVIVDALRGLHAAHVAVDGSARPLRIVHRDVSPHNILVGTDGLARVIDFGVAKAVGRMQRTAEGEVKGKLAYMAPEQLTGRGVSARSDVFSAGVVLWEFLTGRKLFAADNEGAVIARILSGDIQRPKDVWAQTAHHTLSLMGSKELASLDDVAMRALKSDPDARHPTAASMADALAAAMDLAPVEDVAAWVKSAARVVLLTREEAIQSLLKAPRTEPSAPAAPIRPIIVADLADAFSRDYLTEIALRGQPVHVPLVNAPVDLGEHILEVHVPGEDEPTLFLAHPLGPPTAAGFPLRLKQPEHGSDVHARRDELPTRQLEPRTHTHHTLTEGHTRDLGADGNVAMVEASVLGRVLGGGKLEIQKRVGGGGGGAVYRARHVGLRKTVAVKVLHDSAQQDLTFCARFHAEALAASGLDHQNLVRVLDYGQEPDGVLYLSMEYLDGTSLRGLLDQYGRLPAERALRIMAQVTAGLVHAHERGVVHRDVKPSNVMLVLGRDDDGNPTEVAKVCDFGIALHEDDLDGSGARIAGTPSYMSPEQCQGLALDGRTDVYSCGVMLYELLTGRVPFDAASAREVMDLHLRARVPPLTAVLPSVDPRLSELTERALAKDPAARFPAMRDMRNALRALLARGDDRRSIVPAAAASSLNVDVGRTATNALADAIKRAPVERLAQLGALASDPPRFVAELDALSVAVVVLARRRDVSPLLAVVRVVSSIYEEAARSTHPAAQAIVTSAVRTLHSIANSDTLAEIATFVVGSDGDSSRELALLAWAEVSGALALYNARSIAPAPEARVRFVTAMRHLARSSGPVIKAALNGLFPADATAIADVRLVHDLLSVVPTTRDDALGNVLSRYTRASDLGLVALALSALVPVWGERAHPLLLASLGAPSAAVRVAALRGLVALHAVDAFVVQKIEAMLRGPALPKELESAAYEALAAATPAQL